MRIFTPIWLLAITTALPALAAAPSPFGKMGNKKSPIEITADNLEVFQQEDKAIFTGHVIAIQDDVRLKSDKMTVFYTQKSDAEKNAQKAGDTSSIERIEVEGNVFLATPGETASGLSGIYDVAHQQIVLDRDVVLTRGKNTLKGTTLVYNLETGKSMLSSSGTETLTNGKTGKQRVRALLVPEGSKTDGNPPAKKEKEQDTKKP